MLDDNEARYLIDQYNTYISWRVGRGQLPLVVWSLFLAIAAVCVSIMALAEQYGLLALLPEYFLFAFLAAVLVVLYRTMRDDRRAVKMYKGFETGLTDLEDYRRTHKSVPNMALPDEITLKLLVETPEKVGNLLGKGGPNEQGIRNARVSEGILTGLWHRELSKGTPRALIGVGFIVAGFILGALIPLQNITVGSVPFNNYNSFGIGSVTAGMVLIAEGTLEHMTHGSLESR